MRESTVILLKAVVIAGAAAVLLLTSSCVQKQAENGVEKAINILTISAGWYYSLALCEDGSVWAWGYNEHGQLGNGNLRRSLGDVKVTHAGGSSTLFQEGFCPDEGDRLTLREPCQNVLHIKEALNYYHPSCVDLSSTCCMLRSQMRQLFEVAMRCEQERITST